VNDRATAPALTYVFAIGITTILVSGLLITSTGFVDDSRDRTVREELEIVGERVAASIEAVDRASDGGATVSRRMEIPGTVVDTSYRLDIVDCPDGAACLTLRSADPTLDLAVNVPLDNRSIVSIDRPRRRQLTIVAAVGSDPPASAGSGLAIDPNVGVGDDADPAFSTTGTILDVERSVVVTGFEYQPSPPSVAEPVTLTADVGGAGAGNLTYQWDLDADGTFEVSGNETAAKTITHTYSEPGRYEVVLRVEDDVGRNDSVTRLLRVSGLVFKNNKTVFDADANGDTAGVEFDVKNNFESNSIVVTEVLVDPPDDTIDELDNGGDYEIVVDTSPVYDESLDIEPSGSIANFDSSVTLAPGQLVSVRMAEFYRSGTQADMIGEDFTVAFRYEIENSRRNYVSEFRVGTGGVVATGDPPVIQDADSGVDEGDYWFEDDELYVDLSLTDPDGDLDSVTVESLDTNGDVVDSEAVDLTGYGGSASGRIVIGDYDGDAEQVRIVVTDAYGNSANTTVPVDTP
jgi:hypothetical protein